MVSTSRKKRHDFFLQQLLIVQQTKPNMANQTQSGGIGFLGLLAIVFIVLKLVHVIAWSWWWVLLPVYAPLAIAVLILIIWLIVQTVKK